MTARTYDDARVLREFVIRMLQKAGSGHSASALALADLFAVLYGRVLRLGGRGVAWRSRDRLLMSNGHACPVLYAALAHYGFIPEEELWRLRQLDGALQGHPEAREEWGIEISAGSLGQGLSQAVGVALAARLQREMWHTYVLISDGECQEGQTWEALMAGAKYALSNLTVLLDRNFIQISGVTEHIMPLEPLADKLAAFGWRVYEVNGHDHAAIFSTLSAARDDEEPSVVMLYTEPGRGVEFMEGEVEWHGQAPSAAEAELALHQIRGDV